MPDFTLVDDGRPLAVTASITGPHVRLTPGSLAAALGWEVGDEGLCRDDVCVPVPAGVRLLHDDGVDLTALATLLDRPLAVDVAERAAYLGRSARERGAWLETLEAPDFALPDLDGRLHRLADHRGRKVLLVCYASW